MSRRVKAALAAAATALAVPAALAVAATNSVPITVTPKTGDRQMKFVVGFRAPASTNESSTTVRYTVGARTTPGSGCVSEISRQIDSATAGEGVHVGLKPRASKAWCGGSYKGIVDETITPKCPPHEVCPEFVAVARLGRLSFRVK